MHDLQSVRQGVLRSWPELPLHRTHPAQLLHGGALLAAALGLNAAILRGAQAWDALGLPERVALGAASIALGLVYGLGGFFAHEVLHGSVLRPSSRPARMLVRAAAWLGFLVYGCSPELWLTWHNRVHHFHTNESGVDPDSFGLWSELKQVPMADFVLRRAPGARTWLSWVYLPLNFSNQAATVMWFFLFKDSSGFASVRKPVAVAETLGMYLFWAAFVAWAGAWASLWALLIPLLVGNLVVSSFILVQHLFCPLSESNEPLETTLGVELPRWLDRLTFNFGHHVEHHCFPEVNHTEYPRLRALLRARYPQSYRLLPFATAVRVLLSTPRAYRDARTLFEPRTGLSIDVSDAGRAGQSRPNRAALLAESSGFAAPEPPQFIVPGGGQGRREPGCGI